MSSNRLKLWLLSGVLMSCVTLQGAFAQVCYPPHNSQSELIYDDGFNGSWVPLGWPQGVVTWNPSATPSGKNGSYAVGVNFGSLWNEFVLYRDGYFYPASKRALVFRIKGIGDNWMQQVWLELRNLSYVPFATVEVTDHMITPPINGWQYDPNQWYTVVIPMWAFFSNAPMSIHPGTIARDLVIRAGTSPQIFIDDMWWVGGLEFPLKGYTPETAPISSVFDHTMADLNGNIDSYKRNRVVTAYTGEVADGAVSSTDVTCVTGVDAPYNGQITNYIGASICSATDRLDYLSYDGHPGIDYAVANVPVYPAAEGVVIPGRCLVGNAGGTCTGWGAVGIDHGNGYITQYWHMRDIKVEAGARVSIHTAIGTASDVGTPGAYHLHFEVLQKAGSGYVHVDPYGWTGNYPDPHRVKGVSVRLWK